MTDKNIRRAALAAVAASMIGSATLAIWFHSPIWFVLAAWLLFALLIEARHQQD